MASYVYMTNPAKISKFLKTIQGAGVPKKLTYKHLESLGFKSNNDRPLTAIIKALGFTSSSGEPTERWSQYRHKAQSPIVLAQGIREHYMDLFNVYPDANLKDNEALNNFFSTHTTVGAGTVKLMIATFKTLVGLADFQADAPAVSRPPAEMTSEANGAGPDTIPIASPQVQAKGGLGVNINIELALPENATAETFDAFFKSMKKYLLD